MISLKQIKINARKINSGNKIDEIIKVVCRQFRLDSKLIKDFKILKEGLDARQKPDIFYSYNVCLSLPKSKETELIRIKKKGQIQIDSYSEIDYRFPELKTEIIKRPVIVGSGPAGLFAAYLLAENGFRPILLERGSEMSERKLKVDNFIKNGILDAESNIQFGEGGAGTFSDGKLNTGTKDKLGIHKKVLEIFIDNGAPSELAYESKPHIGTDVLENVVVSMRNRIIRNGGLVLFNNKLTSIKCDNNKLISVVVNGSEIIETEHLILAIGHSARDTFRMINDNHIEMTQKPFAVGVRVIHEQKFINDSQYGPDNDYLPAADYKITTHTSKGRNVYSFCMCPGGFVVPAASFDNETVVNGMSYSRREGKYANSAMVVNVNSEDFGSDDLFAGMDFQEKLELNAYKLSGGVTPIQSYKGFAQKLKDNNIKELADIANNSILGKVECADLSVIFPDDIHNALCEGLLLADSKFNGFTENMKLIAGVETRTSSPVKIIRDEFYESNIKGIYPCGEGAGYAGGIMSAAVDGIKVAAAVANKINGD